MAIELDREAFSKLMGLLYMVELHGAPGAKPTLIVGPKAQYALMMLMISVNDVSSAWEVVNSLANVQVARADVIGSGSYRLVLAEGSLIDGVG